MIFAGQGKVVAAFLAVGMIFLPGLTPAREHQPLRSFPVAFESEIIRIFIEPDSLRVEGLYHLRGVGDRQRVVNLNYPYPEDSKLGGARTDLLEARTDGPWIPLGFSEMPDDRGALWHVPINPGSPVTVRTVYRQQRLSNYARYIVTTTRAWTRPLKHARFEIYLPSTVVPRKFSYDFQPGTGEFGPCWVYEEKDFWPHRDIWVSWDGE